MQASKPEQIAWASLIATLLTMVYYSIRALALTTLPALLWTYVTIVIAFAAWHIAAALSLGRPLQSGTIATDERDRHIQSLSNRIAFFALFGGVNLLLLGILLGITPLTKTVNLVHILFMLTFGAHAVQTASQIIQYRRGF